MNQIRNAYRNASPRVWRQRKLRLPLLLFAALIFGAVSAAFATLMISQSSLNGSAPVIVSKVDGSTVRGTLSQCTPELLFVTPAPSPSFGNRAAKNVEPPATRPLEIPWKKVRSVNDGLTPRIALDIWMAQHAGHLCPTCHGERTIWCPVCKGTRHDPAAAVNCPTCHGELLVDCKTVGEKDGKIACPNSCLKLSVGTWVKQPDGLMWRVWRFHHGNRSGTQSFSTRHLGDVMFDDPKALPPISDLGKCPVCGGTMLVDDPICFGTGKVPCPTCLARTTAAPCPNHCDNGRVICPTCGGTGLQKDAGTPAGS